jgi:hypothetical protein
MGFQESNSIPQFFKEKNKLWDWVLLERLQAQHFSGFHKIFWSLISLVVSRLSYILIEDKYIRLNSKRNTTGDGGIVILIKFL